MPVCFPQQTIRTPILRPRHVPKSPGRTREDGALATAPDSTKDWHRYRHLATTQHRPRVSSKTSDDTSGKQIGPIASENDRRQELLKLRSEKLRLDASLVHLQGVVDKAMDSEPFGTASTELFALQKTLRVDVMVLKCELEDYRGIDPQQLEKKKGEAALMRANAERWTNNIELLEGWLGRVLGVDPHQLDCLRRECYGTEYTEGEGLKEL
ncbi:Meiotic nuclear division protein 1 [Xanthoria parietina]